MSYDTNHSDVQNILNDFNTIHPKLKFTAECEKNNQISCLDITINRIHTDWRITVYRKPTFTDTTIPYNSNHPTQHKYATIRFVYNRLNTYNLQEDDYNTEIPTIQNILQNKAFPVHNHKPPPLQAPPPTYPENRRQPHTHAPPNTQMGHPHIHR